VRPLLTPRWLARHALAVTLVLACAVLAWWQVSRAAEGNLLSYGYAVLWPVFGGFVVLIWVREMRVAVRGAPVARPVPAPREGFGRPVLIERPVTAATAGDTAGDDPALMEYNGLLAWLAANPGARPADYPGGSPVSAGAQPVSSEESS
jgi:DNA-binding transcriptional regulator of glucitol operon